MKRDGKEVYLGSFATAEEAALCVARSPEGQSAAAAVAAMMGGGQSQRQSQSQSQSQGA